MMSIINVKNVSFAYPAGVTALKNINLEIKKGEVLAIIGHNGSGKTTLVKHFNGLLKPTRGEVLVNGVPTKGLTTAKLSQTVGYIFQDPDDQIFNTTVYNEVAFGPRNLKLKKAEVNKRVIDALRTVGLLELKNEHPLDLNLSQKKLLAIASIISMKPEVIIFDEALTGQDHAGVRKVESLINDLKKEHTIILISHNMQFISRIATRVVVMGNARILFEGTPKQVFVKKRLLSKTYLKPPLITQLAQSIKGMRKDILTINEFIDELQKFRKR